MRQTTLRTVSRERTAKPSEKSVSPAQETLPVTREFRNIVSTIGEMERMIEETFHRPFFGMLPFRHLIHELGSFGEVAPNVDIYEQGGSVIVKAELPGIRREDINVKLVENSLVISGEKKTEEKVEQKDYLRLERSYGSFSRSLRLPEGVDTEKARASFKDGILEIRIPKTEPTSIVRQVKVE